jgi:hypothetical protein
MIFLEFPAFCQAHSDPQIRLAGKNSDCGGLDVMSVVMSDVMLDVELDVMLEGMSDVMLDGMSDVMSDLISDVMSDRELCGVVT